LLVACVDDDPAGDDVGDVGDPASTYTMTGRVIDFRTLEPIAGQAVVATDGITPPPRVGVQGADFEITAIPPGSVFHVLAGASLGYHSTYAGAYEVVDDDLHGARVRAVSDAYAADLRATFGVPASGGGVLIAQLVDEAGEPLAGVDRDALEINGSNDFIGPFFLDDALEPDPRLDATGVSGYVVFFDIPPGLVAINGATGSGYSMTMTPSPVAGSAVTLATVSTAVGDDPVLPSNVSFEADVLPIFTRRGCATCHSKKEIGNEVGGLSLDERDRAKIYKEVVEELSGRYGVPRVDLANPESSLILTQPSPEDPPDAHPNVTFRGPTDLDYQLILVWIREGALKN
jgi:hypothetical protein